jgi:hypothetical protein
MGIRLVFLDVDGVLNSRRFFQKADRNTGLPSGESIDKLCPESMACLNKLLRVTDAKVVLSSVWRFKGDVEHLAKILRASGFRGDLIGMTPDLQDEFPGGLEIESFVILDDDSDMGPLLPRLVKTKFDDGLTDHEVAKAIAMLVPDADSGT